MANQQSAATNYEFPNIQSNWIGYVSSVDKTNLAPNIMVRGSKNIYKKLSGTLAVREGQKRLGLPDTTQSRCSSSFIWNTSWAATYTMVVSNSTLYVVVADVWYELLGSLSSTRYVFDKWWDNSAKKDKLLFVDGSDDLFEWGGGFGFIVSTTSNSIVLDRTIVASMLPASGTVIINGTSYTYSGSSGSTLTGVSGDPTGEANGSGVLEAVVTNSTTPASGFANDFIKVVNNQVYVGSYTSRLCYISKNTDYTDYSVPTPRAPGDPELLTLDGTLNGISVRQGNAYISFGSDGWAAIVFENITVGSTLTQQTNVQIKPVAINQAAFSHEMISSVGDNIVYLAKDQQVRVVGDFNNAFTPRYPSFSQAIATELAEETFTGGTLNCIGEFIYLTAPNTGNVYLRQERTNVDNNGNAILEILWHSPFIWNLSNVLDRDGTLIGFSNANPQIYQLWDTDQWFDDSPSEEPLPYQCTLALSYWGESRRQGLWSFDKLFTEGYLTQGTPLDCSIQYNYQGATGISTFPINSLTRPAYIFLPNDNSAHVLGDEPLGQDILGDEFTTSINPEDALIKFKNISSLSLNNCFEYQIIYTSNVVNARWEILAVATNATVDPENNATFIINKIRNSI